VSRLFRNLKPVDVPELGDVPEDLPEFPIPPRTGARELPRGAPPKTSERARRSGTFTGAPRGKGWEPQAVGVACFSSSVAKRGAAPSTCFWAIPRSFS